jgi:hypothetical protein
MGVHGKTPTAVLHYAYTQGIGSWYTTQSSHYHWRLLRIQGWSSRSVGHKINLQSMKLVFPCSHSIVLLPH